MRRRQFIAGLVSAVTWPVVARAQQPDRMRRIGVLQTYARDDPNALARLAAFEQGLQELGWIVGRDIQIDYRFGGTDPDLYRKYAAELVALAPDVILAQGPIGELPQATRTVPIVFVGVTDPVARGLVVSLARPGGNATGFILFEFSLSGKWLGLLKQMAASNPSSGHPRSFGHCRGGPIRRDPVRGGVVWGGANPDWRAQFGRDRARRHRIRARSEWRPNSDVDHIRK